MSFLAAKTYIHDRGLSNLVFKTSVGGDMPTCIFPSPYLSSSWKVSQCIFKNIIVIFPYPQWETDLIPHSLVVFDTRKGLTHLPRPPSSGLTNASIFLLPSQVMFPSPPLVLAIHLWFFPSQALSFDICPEACPALSRGVAQCAQEHSCLYSIFHLFFS